jgi:SEL1 protein
MLIILWRYGDGCQAKELFERAAEAGNIDGYYNLGILYLKGLGVEKDYGRARELLVEAANRQHPKARYHLANMLHKGLAGMKKDLAHVSELRGNKFYKPF